MQSLTPYGATPASARFFTLCARILQPSQKRHESTYRRSRSKLNIKPDPAFLPTKTEQHDHIIYNPPPSMPNVYHTPTIFLPQNDKRRAIQAALKPYAQPEKPADQLPLLRKPAEKKSILTKDDVEEMRKLRLEDPMKWTQTNLSRRYNCATIFARMVIKSVEPRGRSERDRHQKAVEDAVRSHWGPKRRIAREDRAIRKDRWFRDE